MDYYKSEIDGYVTAIAAHDAENHRYAVESIEGGLNLSEIDEAEYNRLLSVLSAKPYEHGYFSRLKADTLEWELVELPPAPDDEAEVEDYENALADLGVKL